MDRSLKLSLIDAFLYSLMVGVGETYLPAYVLSVGLSEIYAGLLASLPLLSGALIQLLAPRGIDTIGSTKNWIVLSTTVQACAYLPLIYFSMYHAPEFWTLFLILTLYWGAGFAAAPAWNYWMGHLVPKDVSSKFFSRRARILQTGILTGLILGGIALHNKILVGSMTSVFAGMFLLAFICRLLSSLTLSRKNFASTWEVPKTMSLLDTWKLFWRKKQQNRFFVFLFFYQISIFISSPFVAPYMLAQVKMDYGGYMGAIAALMIGKIIALWFLEKMKNQRQGFDLLIWGLISVSPLPALWAFGTNYWFIVGLQIASGMAWACLEVGLMLIFFKDLSAEEKIPFLTFYNLLNSIGIIVGTGVGALGLYFFGEFIKTYHWIFVLGALARMITAWPLFQQIRLWKSNSQTSGAGIYPRRDQLSS